MFYITAIILGTTTGFLSYILVGGKNYQLGVALALFGALLAAAILSIVERQRQ